ncbi:MAG: MBL fold metallo-hydrolase [Angelakisella sp.]
MKLIALFLALMLLLAGCGAPSAVAPSSSSAPPAVVSSSSLSEAPSSSSEAVPVADADRYAEVFDSAADAGKLTIRFLKLTSTDPETKSGDSSIITFPDGKVMLVDAGNPTCGETVVAALKAMGVTKLDAILNSHPHVDHLGGFPAVIEAFPVEMIYRSKLTYSSNPSNDFEAAVAKTGLPVTYLQEGDKFDFGGTSIEIFNPIPDLVYPANYPKGATQFINNNSLLMKITYGKSTMLLGGDLYTPGEDRVMKAYGDRLQADVVKANHHGDATSNSRAYIRTIKPKICVMMHDAIASLDVYKSYRKYEAATYLTYLDGCVKVAADDAANYTTLTQFDRKSDFLK